MKQTAITAALATTIAFSGNSSADGLDSGIDDQIAAIKARISALEAQVQDQNKLLRERDREIAELRRAGGDSDQGWFQSVEIGGVVEVEVGHEVPFEGDSTSDVVVATAEVGIATQLNDWVSGEITLLYEEDETDLEVDVATITVAAPGGPWFVTSGQQYVPFGSYETHLISDPLTLEVGETRESAILAGLESNGFSGAAYIFNGDNKEGDNDEIGDIGAVVGYARDWENGAFAIGVGYINDIGESDTLQDAISDNLGGNRVNDRVSGFTVDVMFATGPFTLIGEYIAANDEFKPGELGFDGDGAKPTAFNIEAGYGFMLGGRDATVAIAYQGTDEALAMELPETRVAAALSVEIMNNTTISFEWAHDDDYDVSEGGTGNSADIVTAQLAIEF